MRWALVALCVVSAGCPESRTTLLVHIDAPGLTVTALSIRVKLGTGGEVAQPLPSKGGVPKLPGDALVILPDVATSVVVSLAGVDNNGGAVSAEGTTTSSPHHELEMSLTLHSGTLVGDGGVPDDAGDGGVGGDGSVGPVFDLTLPDLPPLVPTQLSIVAGQNGGAGEADGIGSAARVNSPQAILTVGSTIYFTDNGGQLRQFDPSTLQVSSIPLVDFGGSPYTLSTADGLAYDAANSIFYVASTNESAIVKITVTAGVGHESLVAGMRYTDGASDGIGNAAGFKDPQGIALDGLGNLWVADTGNATVRVINLATQQVLTPAGTAGMTGWVDATGPAARFNRPNAVAVLGANIFVSDGEGGATGNSGVRVVAPSPSPSPAMVWTLVGTPGMQSLTDGALASAGFGNGSGIIADSSSLWVVDTNRNNVRNVTLGSGGMVTTIVGSPMGTAGTSDGNGKAGLFQDPRFIALTATAGWVTDDYESVIRRFDLAGPNAVTTPIGAAARYGLLDASGNLARFNQPAGVVAGGPDFVYVSEIANETIRKLTISTGAVETVACGANLPPSTDGTGTNCSFGSPGAIALDNSGNIYVAEAETSVIREVTFPGGVATVTTVAGTRHMPGNVDDVGTAARFDTPSGIAFDGDHTFYICDYEQDTIRSYDANTKMVTTIAGVAGMYGGKNGAGLQAHFANPTGLAWDRAGAKLYVAEDNCDIRVITFNPTMVARLAGQFGTCGHDDGSFATTATFQRPQGMVADLDGRTLWVTDYDAGTIRKLDLGSQMVTTPIGVARQQATIPGMLPASLNTPYGVALVPAGLIITSFNENVVLLAH